MSPSIETHVLLAGPKALVLSVRNISISYLMLDTRHVQIFENLIYNCLHTHTHLYVTREEIGKLF